ncbi:MAG TPA: hypothetical protein VEK08_01630, partial [Planctomycetota bacterium]|nr:hypothetical protein [Planctomycetota bacterium]
MARTRTSAGKRLRRWLMQSALLYYSVACWVYLIDALPLGFARFLGRCGGRLAYYLDWGHRAIALNNLAIAFPEKDRAEHLRILKACYVHLGLLVVDFCKCKSLTADDVRTWIVPEDGALDRMNAAKAQNKGIIAVSAHIGSWELAGFAFPTLGFPAVSIARKIVSDRIEALVHHIRTRLGNEVVHKEGALRHMLRAFKEKKALGIIMDQHAGNDSPWIPFFGREASTVDSVARLHIRTGAPAMFNVMIRRPDGKYTWRSRTIQIPPPRTEQSEDERVREILIACNREMEDAIR